MAGLRVDSLRKVYPGRNPVIAINDMSLDIGDGEMLVLLGPSGCGKTTTLRCLAGLDNPTSGSITFGSKSVFDSSQRVNLAPERRDLGMVFQSYALWPHKTVAENIGYPLKARGLRNELGKLGWVEEAARSVGCENLLTRYPGQLSGGQQQRVALARALVARPAVILFDEPLSNLDARLRDSVRAEIHELHQRIGFTGIYVTHDQAEAFALGDRLAIMREGVIEQLGDPQTVFERPTTEYVAEFVGYVNAVEVRRTSSGAWTTAAAGEVEGMGSFADTSVDSARLRLRAQDLLVLVHATPPPGYSVLGKATIEDSVFAGHHLDVSAEFAGARVHANFPLSPGGAPMALRAGEQILLAYDPRRAVCFIPSGETLLSKSAVKLT